MNWRTDAACRDADPNLFFPIGTAGPAVRQIEEAKSIGRACRVPTPCLAWALDQQPDAGIWGETTEEELSTSAEDRADRAGICPADSYPAAEAGLTETRPRTAGGRIFRSASKADKADLLFRDAYPELARWVRRLVDDDDIAHEVASEAFVRLLSRWTRVKNPRGYLHVIAANLVMEHWRKAGRERRAGGG